MKLSISTYRDKVMGCWRGKNIGGTLGAPFEGFRKTNEDVKFYVQDLSKGPPPNDDLDLQLVWLAAVEKYGRQVDAHILAEYWTSYIIPNWAEYGMGKANLRAGLPPPLSGMVDNVYRDSCGCFIRSEIWACLAPGRPGLAARYAWEDAIVDHAGDGALCEVFFAAMQSAAFVESDPLKLIDIALGYVPADCAIARAIAVARDCAARRAPFLECRRAIHDAAPGTFGVQGRDLSTIPSDGPTAIQIGRPGFDGPENSAFAVAALLYYPDDFEKALLFANSFGEDTDCTCATLGATLGILHGAARLPEKWTAPLADRIVTGCIDRTNIDMQHIPNTIGELTERVLRVAPGFLGWQFFSLAPDGYEIECLEGDALRAPSPDRYLEGINANACDCEPTVADRITMGPYAIYRRFPGFAVAVDLQKEPFITPGEEREIHVVLHPVGFLRRQQWVRVTALPSPGVVVRGAASREVPFNDLWRNRVELVFTVNADEATTSRVEILFDFAMPGRATQGAVKAILFRK